MTRVHDRVRGLVHGLVHGLTAAVRSAAVVHGRAFDALLQPPTPACVAPTQDPAVSRAAHAATRVAFVALRVLRRVPGWRNTCLYRAVAECLVLRGLGMPATLRLGVARAAHPAPGTPISDVLPTRTAVASAIAAHAWVDCPGHRCRTTDGREADIFATLRRATRGSVAHPRLPTVSP